MKTEQELAQMSPSLRHYYKYHDRYLEKDRSRYHDNKEKEIARRTEWRNRNKVNADKDRAADAKYRENNRELRAQKSAEWRKNNPEEHRLSMLKSRLKTKYNLTIAEYTNMLDKQNNCCAVCGLPFSPGKNPAVDHCHNTGKIRGLLHPECNSALGLLRDNPDAFRKAADYLEAHK